MDDKTIFLQALELESPQERSAFLDEACAGDVPLRNQVEGLLRASEDTNDGFLETPALVGECDIPDDSDDEISLDFLASGDAPDSLGRLGHYEILEVLGQGGAGIVFKAHDPKLNRFVAVKVLAPQIAANPTARKRFLREAHATAAVSHPHVITIHAVDEHEQTPYLVMECIDGRTLEQKIRDEGALDVESVLRIGLQTAQGLAAAHAQGLIHRDTKPANILLENGIERVKITDFGLARASDDVQVTKTGFIGGTPQYMSPEQAQGHPLDHRSDLFSLGSVIYAMCAGRSPFRADSTIAVIRRVCDDTPRPLCQINSEVPPWLAQIIDKLLAKNPDDRFQSASELADLLARHLVAIQHPSKFGQPIADVQGDAVTPLPTEDVCVTAATETLEIRAPRSRRRIAYLATLFLFLVAGLAGLEIGGVTQLRALLQRGSINDAEVPPVAEAKGTTTASPISNLPADSPPLAIAPFDAPQAEEYQQACASHLGVPVGWKNSIGMGLRLIPPGTFETGGAGESNFPKRHITVTRAFYLGATEVTIGQFQIFVEATGYETQADKEGGVPASPTRNLWHSPPHESTDSHPVAGVSVADVEAFCRWLSQKERGHYRLPTEAEWELAARAGTNTKHWYADTSSEHQTFAVFQDGDDSQPQPVGRKRANPYGLHDQYGNLWEWVSDWHAYRPAGEHVDPVGPAESEWKVCAGGCYVDNEHLCSSDGRICMVPSFWADGLGFRVLREVDSNGSLPRSVSEIPDSPARDTKLAASGGEAGPDGRLEEARVSLERQVGLKDWDSAIPHARQIVELEPADRHPWLKLGALLARVDDEGAYRQCCEQMLAQFAEATDICDVDVMCKVCLIRPGAFDVSQLPPRALEPLTGSAAVDEWLWEWLWGTRALVAYRAGDAQLAVDNAQRSIDISETTAATALSRVVQAMALHQLGRTEQARDSLQKAQAMFESAEWLTDTWYDWLIAEMLLREARKLLDPSDLEREPTESAGGEDAAVGPRSS